MGGLAQPLDANGQPIKSVGWDATNHGLAIPQVGAKTTDATGLYDYAPYIMQLFAGAANQNPADAVAAANVLMIAFARQTGTGLFSAERVANVFKPFNAQAVTISSANTPTSIWTPATGKKFRLLGYWFSTTVAAGLVFHDLASVGGAGLLNVPSPVAAANGILSSPPLGMGVLSAAANNQLWIDATAATTLTGFVFGVEE